MIEKRNIYRALPAAARSEVFEKLFARPGLRIERITSCGQVTAPGRWLKQSRTEWVLLLKGKARLKFKRADKVVVMKPGDHILIPRNIEHRVEWTVKKQKTVWVAVHYGKDQA